MTNLNKIVFSYRDGGEETFWNVGDDDADQEDDGVEPVVSEDECDDEEWDTEEDGHSCDEVDEVTDLPSDRGFPDVQVRCQVRDPAHHRPISGVYNHAFCSSCALTECWTVHERNM